MRWFKHMTLSADDEKLSRLMDVTGLEGYGFWWRVVEIVAAKVDEKCETSAEFSPKKWGNSLGISAKKFRTLAELCANFGLFSLEVSENLVRIDIPNILKFKDEYTEKAVKKSGVNRDKLPPSRARVLDTDTETDTEDKKEENTASAPPNAETSPVLLLGVGGVYSAGFGNGPAAYSLADTPADPTGAVKSGDAGDAAPTPDVPFYRTRSGRFLTGKRLETFDRFWGDFAFAKGKTEAADAWLDIPQLTGALVAHICHAARCEAQERPGLEAKGQTPKWPQGWLEARRWEDYPPPQKKKPKGPGDIPAHELPPLTPEEEAAARKKREEIIRLRNARRGLVQEGAA